MPTIAISAMTSTARMSDRIAPSTRARSSGVPALRLLFSFLCRMKWRASTLTNARSADHPHFLDHFVAVHRLAAACGGIDARWIACGHHNDGNVGERGIAPLHSAKRPPIHQWHREVEEDQLRRESHAKELEGFVSV